MRFQSIVLAAVCCVSFLSGCAIPGLTREQIPTEGRYTVLIRTTGKATVMHVGTTIFSNASHQYPEPMRVGELYRDAMVKVLEAQGRFTYVPVEYQGAYEMPRFSVSSYDGSFGVYNTPGYKVQELLFQEEVKRLAAEHRLDFVLVLSEWGDRDSIAGTNQPLEGFGVYLRSFFGGRKMAAYTAYQLRLVETKSGLGRGWSGVGVRAIDESRWIEVPVKQAPAPELIRPFIADIEATVPPADLRQSLCIVGLLPIAAGARGATEWGKCENSYTQ